MTGKTTALVLGSVLLAACSSAPPSASGEPAELAPCPSSPNCVSTQASDSEHAIEPLSYKPGSSVEAARSATMAALAEVVGRMTRTRIVERTERYLHAEYRTLLGFVDDVEFLLEDGSRAVQFRSASRLGYSDLGVNRKRMERVRELYQGLE